MDDVLALLRGVHFYATFPFFFPEPLFVGSKNGSNGRKCVASDLMVRVIALEARVAQ